MKLLMLMGFFVAFFINSEGNEEKPIYFGDLKSIISWSNKLFIKEISPQLAANVLTDSTGKQFKNILDQVEKVSRQLTARSSKMNRMLHNKLNTSFGNIRGNVNLQIGKTLNDFINDVENLHNTAMTMKITEKFDESILQTFIESVLWNANNLPNTLEEIHQLVLPPDQFITPELMKLMSADAQDNLQHGCDKSISAQQQMYYLYSYVILCEMKGLTTLTYVYSIQQLLNKSYNYTIELENSKQIYRKRVQDYHENLLSKVIALFPRQIYSCDVNPFKRGFDFLELYKFSRATLLNEQNLTSDRRHYWTKKGHCASSCSELTESKLGFDIQTSGTAIYNCKYFGGKVKACLANPESNREYLWWKNDEGTFGRNEKCANEVDKSGFKRENPNLGIPVYINPCEECLCSIDIIANGNNCTDDTAIAAISITPQISDIANNMIVTGVKFVVHENAIHLRIQQNRFLENGIVNNGPEWKLLHTIYTHNHTIQDSKLKYLGLNHTCKSIQLDDVLVPDNYAVTGVKFTIAPETSNFALNVYGTPFDINTGSLNPNGSKWFSPGQYTLNPSDYERDRNEIQLIEPDDPTRCRDNNYDRESNKVVKFIHSDVRKDAGQNTVPFFDAQSVKTQPSFPLSGIGLYYKGREGCGGYIAPRIYTIDTSKYVKSHH